MLRTFYHRLNTRFPALGRFLRRIFLGESSRVRRSIQGDGNILKADSATLSDVELDIIGNNNQIIIGEGSTLINSHFRIRGSGHCIEFGRNCRVSRGGMFWFENDNGLLNVGQKTTMVDVHIAITEPGSKVLIGEDCMFANDIDIRSGDSHSIIDAQTGERLNDAQDIIVGRHVWIAPHVVILKGVHIGENSVVATGSIVTKSCESGVVIAGNPAQVVKTGISWKRDRIPRTRNEPRMKSGNG